MQLFNQLYFSFIELHFILQFLLYLGINHRLSRTFVFFAILKKSMNKKKLLKTHKRNEIDLSVFSNIFYTKLLENIIDLKKGAKRQS